MKKYLTILFCIFILMFSCFSIIKTNAKTDFMNEYNATKTEKYNIIKEKQEIIEKEKLEKEKEAKVNELKSSAVVKVSTTNEYVQNSNLTVKTNNVTYGTFGRLYLPGYSAALYDYNVNTSSGSSLQTIVNNPDSAAYYLNGGKLIIADHSYQGFSVLAYLTEGTKSYIKFEDGSAIGYTLIKKSKGVNTGPDLIDADGNSFFNMPSDIIMYTCYEDGIMATLWALS